jgi:hypothetical protein
MDLKSNFLVGFQGKMVDLILVVDNPEKWHADNLRLNPGHYSFMRMLGPKRISQVQRDYGAKLYFNPMVTYDDMVCEQFWSVKLSLLITSY